LSNGTNFLRQITTLTSWFSAFNYFAVPGKIIERVQLQIVHVPQPPNNLEEEFRLLDDAIHLRAADKIWVHRSEEGADAILHADADTLEDLGTEPLGLLRTPVKYTVKPASWPCWRRRILASLTTVSDPFL
jgi:hypothetical protein